MISGQVYYLYITVRNLGKSRSSATKFYSVESFTEPIDLMDASGKSPLLFVPELDASDSYTFSVAIVKDRLGTVYYGACVEHLSVESNISNNCSTITQLTVEASERPLSPDPDDLVIESSSLIKHKIWDAIRATVRNPNPYRYSRTNVSIVERYDVNDTSETIGVIDLPSLDAYESITVSYPINSITSIDDFRPSHYVCLGGHNCSSGHRSNKIDMPPPKTNGADLVIEPLTVVTDPSSGPRRIVIFVYNQGDIPAASTLRLYRSSDNIINNADIEIDALLLPKTRIWRVLFFKDRFIRPGNWYYGVCIDPAEYESNVDNNCSSGVPVTVKEGRERISISPDVPDLAIVSAWAKKALVVSGNEFTLYVTVHNLGTRRSSPTILRFSDQRTRSVPELEAFGSITLSHTTFDRSALHFCLDRSIYEFNTRNNCSAIRLWEQYPIISSPSRVDKSTLTGGEEFEITNIVQAAGGPVSFYQSSNPIIDNADIKLGDARFMTPDLIESRYGKPERQIARLKAFAPSFTGETTKTWYYGACVRRLESDYGKIGNFCSSGVPVTVIGPPPTIDRPHINVVVESLSTSKRILSVGEELTIHATVRNRGTLVSAPGPLRYYQSFDRTINYSDIALGENHLPELGQSDSSTMSLIVHAPSSPGNWYYGACSGGTFQKN